MPGLSGIDARKCRFLRTPKCRRTCSQILYAPTFLANSLALGRYGLEKEAGTINARLVALSRAAAPGCLIVGNLTTLQLQLGMADEANFDRICAVYREPSRTLADAGVDLLATEMLLHPPGSSRRPRARPAIMVSFPLRPDRTLRSGMARKRYSAKWNRSAQRRWARTALPQTTRCRRSFSV